MKSCWMVEAPEGTSVQLQTLEYGKVPPGWKEIIHPEPLQEGAIYLVNDNHVFLKEKRTCIVLPGDRYGFHTDQLRQQLEEIGKR